MWSFSQTYVISLFVLFREVHLSQRIPSLFAWATFPLTALLETIWEMHSNTLVDGAVIDPCIIEFTSMVERALNFSHTGNARVLCRRLMDRAWISLGIIHDGLPSISDAFVAYGSLNTGKLVIRQELWPVDQDTRRPLTSSRRTQELTYSKEHYEVSIFFLPFPEMRQSISAQKRLTDLFA